MDITAGGGRGVGVMADADKTSLQSFTEIFPQHEIA